MSFKITANLDRATRDLTRLLTRYAIRVARDLDEVIRDMAYELLNDILLHWPVDSGLSRAAWQGPYRVSYAHWRVVNAIPYAIVIEFGGYPGVGPKTAEEGGTSLPGNVNINPGIYPIQKPSAPVRRALSRAIVRIKAEIENVVRQR